MDKRHFERFYNAYMTRIYKFVYFRVAGNRALAQDLTQDIFMKAFEAFDRYDPTVSQVSWIYTIARNHVINNFAKTHPGVSLEEVEGTMVASMDAREQFATRHDEEMLLRAIGELSPDEGDLVRKKYLEGWSFEDLEQILGKTSGALRVQASRALKKLKKKMKDPYSVEKNEPLCS